MPAHEPQGSKPQALERERDPAFDALAKAGGKDPRALTRSEARTVGVKLAEIIEVELKRLHVSPKARIDRDRLAEIIAEAGARYRRLHPEWPITPAAIAGHWSELVTSPPADRLTPSATSGQDNGDPGPVVDEGDAERMREAGEEWRRKHSPEGART